MNNSKKIFSFLFYIVPPLASITIASPIGIIPWDILFRSDANDDLNLIMLIISLPFNLGILAAPGYIYAWYKRPRATNVSKWPRYWIRFSLVIALICSIGGLLAGYWMILFSPPSLLVAIASGRLLYLFEKKGLKIL